MVELVGTDCVYVLSYNLLFYSKKGEGYIMKRKEKLQIIKALRRIEKIDTASSQGMNIRGLMELLAEEIKNEVRQCVRD